VRKFFLHVSKDEQQKRFLERLDNPDKNWKFSANDARERGFWDKYMEAYEETIRETATEDSPWYVCRPTTSGSRALASPYRESGRCHLFNGRRS
jgi:polyphosphate kinase 2 (PPK2 family)